jgi:serine/threonine protein kinase
MSDEINYLTGFSLKDIVSWGNLGMICLDEPSQTIVKSPYGEENKDDIAIEKRIYERFSEHSGHDGLLHYYGPYESGIRLEFACNGNLRSFLKKRAKDIDIERRLRWAKQIADALRFVHSINVVHGDVTCGNILLDGQLNTKLSDFGGSSLDGSPLLVAVTASHRCPRPAISIQGDIFALGSTLYEVMTGYVPYHDFPEEEVEARYSKGEFPETKFLGPIGDIITHCWHGRYSSFDAIIADVKGMHGPDEN